jgi:hypothetical protein
MDFYLMFITFTSSQVRMEKDVLKICVFIPFLEFHIRFQKYPINKTHWKKQKFIVENTCRSSKKYLYSSFSQPRFVCVGGEGWGVAGRQLIRRVFVNFTRTFYLIFSWCLGKHSSHKRFLE